MLLRLDFKAILGLLELYTIMMIRKVVNKIIYKFTLVKHLMLNYLIIDSSKEGAFNHRSD